MERGCGRAWRCLAAAADVNFTVALGVAGRARVKARCLLPVWFLSREGGPAGEFRASSVSPRGYTIPGGRVNYPNRNAVKPVLMSTILEPVSPFWKTYSPLVSSS